MEPSSGLIIVVTALVALSLIRANGRKERERDKILKQYIAKDESREWGDTAREELGDRHPDFKYQL